MQLGVAPNTVNRGSQPVNVWQEYMFMHVFLCNSTQLGVVFLHLPSAEINKRFLPIKAREYFLQALQTIRGNHSTVQVQNGVATNTPGGINKQAFPRELYKKKGLQIGSQIGLLTSDSAEEILHKPSVKFCLMFKLFFDVSIF